MSLLTLGTVIAGAACCVLAALTSTLFTLTFMGQIAAKWNEAKSGVSD